MVRTKHLLLAAALASVAGCGSDDPAGNAGNVVEANAGTSAEPVRPAPLPVVEPPLSRKDVLLAALEAATAFAAGADDSEQQKKLDGRQFAFRIRMCPGGDGTYSTSLDPEESVLRVQAKPDLTEESPPVEKIAGTAFEDVKGFWVPRPWLLQPACPTSAVTKPEEPSAGSAPDEASGGVTAWPRFGIAEFHEPGSSRTGRRGDRPLQVTRKIEEGSAPETVDLVLLGRLTPVGKGKVIACTQSPVPAAPACVVSVRIDAVRFELVPSGEVLAEWSEA